MQIFECMHFSSLKKLFAFFSHTVILFFFQNVDLYNTISINHYDDNKWFCSFVCLSYCVYRSWKIWSLVMNDIKCGIAGQIQSLHQSFIRLHSVNYSLYHTHTSIITTAQLCQTMGVFAMWAKRLRNEWQKHKPYHFDQTKQNKTNTKQPNNNLIALVVYVCT